MFARKKRNKSGSVSIQIIDKTKGYRVIETVGSSNNPEEVERLFLRAKQSLTPKQPNQGWLFSVRSKEDLALENFVESLKNSQVRAVGPELIFGALFDRIGFSSIKEELFRHLTIARLAFPVTSKLKTVDYLRRYRGIETSKDAIYRFLDQLNSRYKEDVTAIAYQYTKARLGAIACVFYDMTTLYFEAEDEDDLRKKGYSKDGKFENPQILLGLLVGLDGLPIGYDIFDGNKFEGHTLLPVLRRIQSKYGFDKPIVVADAALLSIDNIAQLKEEGYRFILGARIRNEREVIREEILKKAAGMKDGDNFIIDKEGGVRLVVTYSEKRSKKDAANRKRGVEKLRKQVQSGRLSKQSINNRGYNRFLMIAGEAEIIIDEERIKADNRWDGLKGFVTNTNLSAKDVAGNYVQLWQIESAFRISKTDLRVRPIHHQLRKRIEAHLCIAFVAYTIYKELDHLLKNNGLAISPKRAGELSQNMYELEYTLPESGEIKRQLLRMDADQQSIYDLIRKP